MKIRYLEELLALLNKKQCFKEIVRDSKFRK